MQDALADEQARVAIMARDYAQWDRTYDFMQNQSADYVRTELTDDTFNIIHINIFLLIDRNGKVILQKGMGGWSLQSSDLDAIAAACRTGCNGKSEFNGLLQLRGHLLLLAYQPILTSRGAGDARGTLVMGRDLNDALMASLSRSAGMPLWLEPIDRHKSPPGPTALTRCCSKATPPCSLTSLSRTSLVFRAVCW
ncbi:MAG: hypothetical protein DMG94_13430 [Acidobacteria bacterium]|nr:MAG: hypothetical protein DMG94_13430 [Acidobacteriota bacterium]